MIEGMYNTEGDFFSILWLLMIIGVIIASIWLFRKSKTRNLSKIELAKKQLAKGEITEEQYKALLREMNNSSCNSC